MPKIYGHYATAWKKGGGWLLSWLLGFIVSLQAERLPIKTYTTADGLAHDHIHRIVRDAHGYLWLATAEGLSRFDGYQFTNYTVDDGLPSRAVSDVLPTRRGDIWVATSDGLCQFHPVPVTDASGRATRFTVYRPPPQRPGAQSIYALLEDRHGVLWCGTRGGLYRFDPPPGGGTFQEVEIGLTDATPDARAVNALAEDRQGALWVGAAIGLFRREPDGRTEHFTERQGILPTAILSLQMDAEGRLWVGTAIGLARVAPERGPGGARVVHWYTARQGLGPTRIDAVFQSATGTLWVGSLAGGLSRLEAPAADPLGTFRTYTTAQGLGGEHVTALAEDRDGNLWVGSVSGAMRIARNGFTTYTTADGLPVNVVGSVAESPAGELYFVAWYSSVTTFITFDGTRFTTTQPRIPKAAYAGAWGSGQVHFQDRQGEWWIPTGQGLYRFARAETVGLLARRRPKAVYTQRDGLEYNTIFRLYEDRQGDVWIANHKDPFYGLNRWERATGRLHNLTRGAGLPDLKTHWLISAFGEDHAGQLWVGSLRRSGLARYRGGRFQVFSPEDGVPRGSIEQIYLDRQGRLWLASTSGGLGRVEDPAAEHPRFIAYTTREGLSSNIVHCLTEDAWGRLYLGTGRGVDRFDPATGHVRRYTAADGLPGNEVLFCGRERAGALWFATRSGLARLVPEPDPPARPPAVRIRGLRVAGQPYPVSDLGETVVPPLVLQPNQNALQIDFVGLSFASGETLRYQHKLEGIAKEWSPAEALRTVHFPSLAPGRYRFGVRAVSSDGLVSEPAVFPFTILPPVWQRGWFLTLAGLLAAALIYAAYRYRVARLIELERVRTRIATDLHDDIGSSLSQMAILSEVTRQQIQTGQPGAVDTAGEIAETARTLVEAMSDIVWSIDPRRDDLRSVVQRLRKFAADVLEGQGIAWSLQAPEHLERVKLAPEQRRHLYLILKEAVHNAARHAGARQVTLALGVTDHHLTAEVRDDGRGFRPAAAEAAVGTAPGGYGLGSQRARAAQLGGDLRIDSTHGKGTRITLRVPLS